jgi:hypothetical protein
MRKNYVSVLVIMILCNSFICGTHKSFRDLMLNSLRSRIKNVCCMCCIRNGSNQATDTGLIEAIRIDNVDQLIKTLNCDDYGNGDVNVLLPYKGEYISPLGIAISESYDDIPKRRVIKFLIEQGADPNTESIIEEEKVSALHGVAVGMSSGSFDRYTLFKLLLAHGADLKGNVKLSSFSGTLLSRFIEILDGEEKFIEHLESYPLKKHGLKIPLLALNLLDADKSLFYRTGGLDKTMKEKVRAKISQHASVLEKLDKEIEEELCDEQQRYLNLCKEGFKGPDGVYAVECEAPTKHHALYYHGKTYYLAKKK